MSADQTPVGLDTDRFLLLMADDEGCLRKMRLETVGVIRGSQPTMSQSENLRNVVLEEDIHCTRNITLHFLRLEKKPMSLLHAEDEESVASGPRMSKQSK